MKIKYKKYISLIFGTLLIAFFFFLNSSWNNSKIKLYWFIPDGVRAEPYLFNVYQWAKEGKLPNIKKLIENGSYGYSYPNFPSHTPTNFATLLTGSYPEIHGINDGPMHVLGKPLDSVAIGGFRSIAKKVPAIWNTLEDKGYKVTLISVPGSTPPDIQKGTVVRGRWGGWGADFPAINFESESDLKQRVSQGRASRWFYFGPQLTDYIGQTKASGWEKTVRSYSEPIEIEMKVYGTKIYGFIYDSTDDEKLNYNRVAFSKDKKTIFSDIKQGQWSQWEPIVLKWKAEKSTEDVYTSVKIAAIKIDEDGFFRIRTFFNNLNSYNVFPFGIDKLIEQAVGPMVDFADNFPAQLIYYPEDKKIFLDEANMSFNWHKNVVNSLANKIKSDVVIHDIYTPNQMLTSKWWMGYVDPNSKNYQNVNEEDRAQLWNEVKTMYKQLDDIVGEILKVSDKNTYIVFSSDHGNVPLNTYVNLNNLFAQKGWLKFTINSQTGEPIIDWGSSKVIYLKMAHVYINPLGLAGNYIRGLGPEYEELRKEVIQTLKDLQDNEGNKPVIDIVKWEDAKKYLQMDSDRAGDLIIANAPGFGWNEEMSDDLAIFSTANVTGYKQAIKAYDIPGMWTPFIVSGPDIKKNHYLGEKPFSLIDQYPTIMKALQVAIPSFVQGKSLPIFKDGR